MPSTTTHFKSLVQYQEIYISSGTSFTHVSESRVWLPSLHRTTGVRRISLNVITILIQFDQFKDFWTLGCMFHQLDLLERYVLIIWIILGCDHIPRSEVSSCGSDIVRVTNFFKLLCLEDMDVLVIFRRSISSHFLPPSISEQQKYEVNDCPGKFGIFHAQISNWVPFFRRSFYYCGSVCHAHCGISSILIFLGFSGFGVGVWWPCI